MSISIRPTATYQHGREYIYIVRGKEGGNRLSTASTHADNEGPTIFNPKAKTPMSLTGTSEQWLKEYGSSIIPQLQKAT
jgi:hypothetical protein